MASTTPRFYFIKSDLKLSLPTLNCNRSHLQYTGFDKTLRETWFRLMDSGAFRYELKESPKSRTLDGRFAFIAQFNPNRASNRRPPQAMLSLEQAFCPSKFNFTKIDREKEVVFEIKAMEDTSENRKPDLVIINVSPLEVGHCLLVPNLDECLPQVLTLYSIKSALRAVLLSGVKNLKAAFNSLCAFASVNHLHWHLYYLENRSLYIEHAAVERLASDCHVTTDYPAPAFVFQCTRVEDIDRVADSIFALTDFLTKENIGHNVFITRGTNFNDKDNAKVMEPKSPSQTAKQPQNGESEEDKNGETDESEEKAKAPQFDDISRSVNVLRVYVWARDKIIGSKDPGAFVIAACELAGQVLLYEDKKYENVTEAEVSKAMKEAAVPTHLQVRDQVKQLFKRRIGK